MIMITITITVTIQVKPLAGDFSHSNQLASKGGHNWGGTCETAPEQLRLLAVTRTKEMTRQGHHNHNHNHNHYNDHYHTASIY